MLLTPCMQGVFYCLDPNLTPNCAIISGEIIYNVIFIVAHFNCFEAYLMLFWS